jgi:hypothetical protein
MRCVAWDVITLNVIQAKIPDVEMIAVGMVDRQGGEYACGEYALTDYRGLSTRTPDGQGAI